LEADKLETIIEINSAHLQTHEELREMMSRYANDMYDIQKEHS